jgi:phage-related protein
MTGWKVEIVAAAQREIASLPADMQARFLHIAEMLQELGPQRVGAPHVRPLGRKLWEMRLRGRDGIARAIYFAASGRRLIVVRAFVKKNQKTPPGEIEIALTRMKEAGGHG